MRRTTRRFLAVAVLVVTTCAIAALVFAPSATSARGSSRSAGHRLVAAVDQARFAPAPPLSPQAGLQASPKAPPAPTVATGSTLLASPKANSPYLMYWADRTQPIVGELGATTWGGPTVRPVIAAQGDWLQIRLDSRPNGSTAWVRRGDVTLSTTPYRIVVSVSQRSLTLYQGNTSVLSAPVGVGQPQWPTPLGPSFVDAVYRVPASQLYIYGPVVLITATHSNVFTEFDGGDGTVGIHGYPSDPASTRGVASSHGCIRANPQTMAAISLVPVGTPIDFVA
jgi:lipoprotein-anchoring transpeptidase ErfK/SrfK